ncbi:YceI family protein [bacterium]|nr:MAG: YceI family protein [bacterium]
MKTLVGLLVLVGLMGINNEFDPKTDYMKSVFVVQGTSNAHEWALEAEVADLDVIVFNDNEVIKVDRFKGTVPVAELKNDNPLMTQDAYQALKGFDFPTITFNLTKVISQNAVTGEVLGKVDLTIAGVKKNIDFVVKTELVSEEYAKLSGWKGMKMTDFGVQPPNFFSGAIQANDDIVIRFEMYVPISELPKANKTSLE